MSDFANRGPLGQKTGNPVNGRAAGVAHMSRVRQLPCIICHKPGPSSAHHVISGRFGQRKASDFETIPLCHDHHQGANGIHTNKTAWETANGPDMGLLFLVADMLKGRFE